MRTQTMIKTRWGIDPAHSEFGFRVKYLMITWVKGIFREVDVNVYTDGDDFLTSEIEVRIKSASIYTGDENRDTHLKSPDFFDVENHRQLVFISRKLEKKGTGNYKLYGPLSIKDVAIPVELDVEYLGMMKDPWGVEKAGFSAKGEISRREWELTWNKTLETGGVLVGDEVKIECDIQLVRQTES